MDDKHSEALRLALSKFKPENQEQLRQWIADGTFIERAHGIGGNQK